MNNFGNNNRKQLEEQFKNKFENAQFSPPAHLWEQIDAALDEKPWYRRPLFYWTSGLVAALLLVIMFWFTLAYDNSIAPSDNTIANKIENNNNLNSSEKIDIDAASKEIRTIQTPNDTEVNNIGIDPVPNSESFVSNTTSTIDINQTNSSNNSTSSNNNTTSNLDKDNSDIAISIAISGKDKNSDTPISDESDTKIILDVLVQKEYDLEEFLPFANPYFEKEIFIETDETVANNESNNTTENIRKASGIAITLGINHTQGVYKPSFRTDSLHSGLTVVEAYSSNLADTLPSTNISGNYQQTGIDLSLQFGKNKRWSLNTGLGIGKANYSFGSTNYVRLNTDLNAPINLREFSNNQVKASYEWLQIPIAIGYQFGESRAKKISGFAQLGTAIEFLNEYSYASEDSRFTYALGEHKTTNTQVWTQAGINYHVTNSWVIWAGGTYRSSLSSLINEDGVTFSSQAYGWQVGTRFTIFRSKK